MTTKATSPTARKYERLADEAQVRYEQAKADGTSQPVLEYLEASVRQWRHRAETVQRKADIRKAQRGTR